MSPFPTAKLLITDIYPPVSVVIHPGADLGLMLLPSEATLVRYFFWRKC